jgi:hypothetical protein
MTTNNTPTQQHTNKARKPSAPHLMVEKGARLERYDNAARACATEAAERCDIPSLMTTNNTPTQQHTHEARKPSAPHLMVEKGTRLERYDNAACACATEAAVGTLRRPAWRSRLFFYCEALYRAHGRACSAACKQRSWLDTSVVGLLQGTRYTGNGAHGRACSLQTAFWIC